MSTTSTLPVQFIADWREAVAFSSAGPEPQFLAAGPEINVILAGLEPGQRLPAHPEAQAVYHFLEGVGTMTVNDQTFTVEPGATVIVPPGAVRGMVAETRMAFLAVKTGK